MNNEPAAGDVIEALRTYEQYDGALRYLEKDKWHLCDRQAMRKVLEQFALSRLEASQPASSGSDPRPPDCRYRLEGEASRVRNLYEEQLDHAHKAIRELEAAAQAARDALEDSQFTLDQLERVRETPGDRVAKFSTPVGSLTMYGFDAARERNREALASLVAVLPALAKEDGS